MHGPIIACPRKPVAELVDVIPIKYIEGLEHNQLISSCCRHPENHEIEAFRSNANELRPDIYVFYCPCGRKHTRFLCSNKATDEEKPIWG